MACIKQIEAMEKRIDFIWGTIIVESFLMLTILVLCGIVLAQHRQIEEKNDIILELVASQSD